MEPSGKQEGHRILLQYFYEANLAVIVEKPA